MYLSQTSVLLVSIPAKAGTTTATIMQKVVTELSSVPMVMTNTDVVSSSLLFEDDDDDDKQLIHRSNLFIN